MGGKIESTFLPCNWTSIIWFLAKLSLFSAIKWHLSCICHLIFETRVLGLAENFKSLDTFFVVVLPSNLYGSYIITTGLGNFHESSSSKRKSELIVSKS